MIIKDFNDLKITTMTLILYFSSDIDIIIKHFLPLVQVELITKKIVKKNKLIHSDNPGDLIVPSEKILLENPGCFKNKAFKNAISNDISTKKKNINLKISKKNIQMAGASSIEDGIEAFYHIVNKLKRIQLYLNNKEILLDSINWIKKYVYYKESDNIIIKPNRELINYILKISKNIVKKNRNDFINYLLNLSKDIYYKNYNYEFDEEYKDKILIIKKEFEIFNKLNKREIINYLLNLSYKIYKLPLYFSKLNYLYNLEKIIDYPLELKEIKEIMVNYNYSLGFKIDRIKVNNYFNSIGKFISHYNNAISQCVTIELPYINNKNTKNKDKKIPHHTFLIYMSGSITQSGPGEKLMKPVYNEFMNHISNIYNDIKLTIL